MSCYSQCMDTDSLRWFQQIADGVLPPPQTTHYPLIDRATASQQPSAEHLVRVGRKVIKVAPQPPRRQRCTCTAEARIRFHGVTITFADMVTGRFRADSCASPLLEHHACSSTTRCRMPVWRLLRVHSTGSTTFTVR